MPFTAILALQLSGLLFRAGAAQPPENAVMKKPVWNKGDSWIVQTSTAQVQERQSSESGIRRQKAVWQFQVVEQEQLGPDMCLKVAVTCTSSSNKAPVVIFWADKSSGCLRQIQTNIPSQGQIRTAVERFDSEKSGAAVMGSLSALPLDMPSFAEVNIAKQESTYRVFGAAVGAKDSGIIGFGYQVQQSTTTANDEFVRKVLPKGLAKNIDPKAYIDVSLTDGQRVVRQIWHPGELWPAWSSNGITESWLVSVSKASGQ